MQSQLTVFCPVCSTHLSYPLGVSVIQCPTCSNQFDPNAGQCRCSGCTSLLSYPNSAMYVQCPRCGRTQDPRSGQIYQGMNNSGISSQQSHPNNFAQMSGMQVLPGSLGQSNATVNGQFPSAAVLGLMSSSAAVAVASNNNNNNNNNSSSNNNHTSNNQYKPKAPKKRKDPNAPKAVRNAYMIFCQMTRTTLKQNNPELTFGKLGGRMGEMWRMMSVSEKAPYEKLALEDRDRYRQEMLKWQHSGQSFAKPPAPSLNSIVSNKNNDQTVENGDESSEHPEKRMKTDSNNNINNSNNSNNDTQNDTTSNTVKSEYEVKQNNENDNPDNNKNNTVNNSNHTHRNNNNDADNNNSNNNNNDDSNNRNTNGIPSNREEDMDEDEENEDDEEDEDEH